MVERRHNIMVALDLGETEALDLAQSLAGQATWMKVGMTLYYAAGPSIVKRLKEMGFKVFLDLKLHDIPHQVRGAAYAAASSGADIVSVHALGGSEMVRAAYEGVQRSFEETGHKTQIIAITVLTSMDQDKLASIGVAEPLLDEVEKLERLAIEAGADGVVCSPREAAAVREREGSDILVVTPGVRPTGAQTGDQSRIMTPGEAFDAGASHIVVGRPITQAVNPVEAFKLLATSL